MREEQSIRPPRLLLFLCGGLLLSGALFYGVLQSSLESVRHDFSVASENAGQHLVEHVNDGLHLLRSFELLFGVSGGVAAGEFRQFSRPQLELAGFDGVSFITLVDGDNPYAATASGAPFVVQTTEGEQWFAYSYMAHRDREMERMPMGEHLQHIFGDGFTTSMAQALARRDTVLGGLVSLHGQGDAYVLYRPVYITHGGVERLAGMLAAVVEPALLLEQLAQEYRASITFSLDGVEVSAQQCCGEQSGWLLGDMEQLSSYDMLGRHLSLRFRQTVSWDMLSLKSAVISAMLGLLLTLFAYRTYAGNRLRTAMLLERNRIVRRQVDEQTRALRLSNTELAQQKAALDEHAIVSIADTAGNITYINERFCEISGYHQDELLGCNHRIIKSNRHPDSFYQEMWHTISQGKVWHGEICNRSKDGTEYWVNSSIVPFLDARGQPYQYVSIRTDITAMKLAAQSLAAREYELDTILNTVPAFIWFKDSEGRILRANRQAAGMMHCTPQEVVGRYIAEFFPEDAERYHIADQQVMASGEPLLGVLEEKQLPSGHYFFRLDRVPYRNKQGETIGVVVMATDVTNEETMERALAVNEERLRRSQTFANIGTWDWNIQVGELHWSERIAPLFGYAVGELDTTYENFLNAVHPEDRELVTSAVSACVESGVEYNIEHRVVWPDGQVRWLSEKGDVVRDKDGSPLHMLGVVQDIHDRKMAEQALKESEAALSENEEKFRGLYEMSPVGIALNEMDGTFIEANQAFLDIIGYTADECRALTYWQLTPEEYAPQEAAQLASLETMGRYGPYEKEYLHKDGHSVAVLLNGTLVHDREGKPRIWSIVQDISERKQTEVQLNRFKTTLDVTEDCVFMFDPERLCFFYVNQGAIEQVGYSKEELMQMHPYDLKPDYDEAAFRSLITPLIEANGGATTFETQHQHKDGHTLPVEISLQYIAPQDEPPRFVAIVRNITERVALQRALGDQKRLLDMMHRTITDFVVQSDFHQTTNNMLDALLQLTGSEYGFTGEVHYGDDGTPYLKTHAITNIAWSEESQRLYDEFAVKGFEFRNLNTLFGHVMTSGKTVMSNAPSSDPRSAGLPTGHPPMDNFLGVPVYYGEDLVGMYGIANRKGGYDTKLLEFLRPFDTTYGVIIHSKRIAERDAANRAELLAAKREAEQASKAKSEFLSSMSHELRTPLNAILGFAQLMGGDKNLTAEQHESLLDISNAGVHLLELINEVLDLAKIEAGKMELSIGSVAVADVLEASRNLIAPMAERLGVELVFSPDCFAASHIRADFTRAKQVLLNLLSNGVKYNREGGRVAVECQPRDNGRLRISVHDTGKGIAEVKLRGLFEAFNRLDAEGGSIEGTGIGLVITRQLVTLMDGEIGVESVVGVGSTFWFELPLAAGGTVPQKATVVTPPQGASALGSGRTVLYIEDNPVNLKLVQKLIEKRSAITLLSAEEPLAGIELALAHRPDLILLDINLPQMSGYEVLRHLREMAPTRDIPVVALSANAMAGDLQKGAEAGFNGYLTKPINVKEFLSVLERMLA